MMGVNRDLWELRIQSSIKVLVCKAEPVTLDYSGVDSLENIRLDCDCKISGW